MKNAQIAGLTARAAPKAQTGLPFLFNRVDELSRLLAAAPDDKAISDELEFTRGIIAEKQKIAAANNEAKKTVAGIAAGAAATPKSGPASLVKLLIDQGYDDAMIDSVIRAQGASSEKDPTADRESREKVSRERIQAQQEATRLNREMKLGMIDQKNQVILSKALGGLEGFENTSNHVEDLINRAISLTDNTSAGAGAMFKGIYTTKARALSGVIDSIRANTGFDYLTQMRLNSPTGGALGNVSDTENKLTQATAEALDQGVDPETLKSRLANILVLRKQLLEERRKAYDRDVEILSKSPLSNRGSAAPAQAVSAAPAGAAPAPSAPISIEDRLKKYQ
jgi:hypothetical protein